VSAASDVHLENCAITAFYVGLYWYSATYYSRAKGCMFSDCNYAAIQMVGTNNITIDTCRITGQFSATADIGPVEYGIISTHTGFDGQACRVINCSIEYFSKTGIYIDGGRATEILGNYFETQESASGEAHIKVGPTNQTSATLIASNHLDGNSTSGFTAINLDHANGVTIVSNYLGSATYGIGITSTANTTDVLLMGNEYLGSAAANVLPVTSYTLDPANPPGNIVNPMTAAGDLIDRGVDAGDHRLRPGLAIQFGGERDQLGDSHQGQRQQRGHLRKPRLSQLEPAPHRPRYGAFNRRVNFYPPGPDSLLCPGGVFDRRLVVDLSGVHSNARAERC
jgi:hypothetical protein